MTWNPLKKPYVTQIPTSAQPCLTPTNDRDLAIAVKKVMHIEDTIRQMIRHMKKYVLSIERLDYSDQGLTKNLSECSLVHIDDEFRRIIEDYHSVTTQIGKTSENAITRCNQTFIDPLKKLLKEFMYIRDALCKREELVKNWKIVHSNLKKYQDKREKTGTHLVKLDRERKAEESTSKELYAFHQNLLTELSHFLEKRVEYMKPIVQAFITIQLNYFGESTKLFKQLMPVPNASLSPSSAMVSEQEYCQTINSHLNRIKDLTIIKK